MNGTIGASSTYLMAAGAVMTGTSRASAFAATAGSGDRADFYETTDSSGDTTEYFPMPFYARGNGIGWEEGRVKPIAVETSNLDEILKSDAIDPANGRRLLDLLEHEDWLVRWTAATRLGESKKSEFVEALYETAIADTATSVRMRATWSLERIGCKLAAIHLAKLAAHSGCETSRSQAVSSCRYLADTDSVLKQLIRITLRSIENENAMAALDLMPL